MTDESLPENIDLSFVAGQSVQILAELQEMRADQAAMCKDMEAMRKSVEQIDERLASLNAETIKLRTACQLDAIAEPPTDAERLTAIEERLARIEKHFDLGDGRR
jgi:hypothetical protein